MSVPAMMLAVRCVASFLSLYWLYEIRPLTYTLSLQTAHHTEWHTHTRLTALCPGLPGWAGNRKATPIWIFMKQETVSGSGISWAVCKSAPHSRQITMPEPHHSVFYRPDALPATQPTALKHWRHDHTEWHTTFNHLVPLQHKHVIFSIIIIF